jgi:hypothetical protein
MLTFPCSLVLIPVERRLGFIPFYERWAGTSTLLYGATAVLTLVPLALFNSFLFQVFGAQLEGKPEADGLYPRQ